MPKFIKPMQVPGSTKVTAMDAKDVDFSSMTQAEKMIFDVFGAELSRRSGTPIEFYTWDRLKTPIDPLYGEATNKIWHGPYNVAGHIDWPEAKPESREEGYRTTWAANAWIARVEFEQIKAPLPVRGDIIRIWKVPYFASVGENNENVPNAGYYFNVVNVVDDGHVLDNADFTGFRLELRRYSEFTPERRIFPP